MNIRTDEYSKIYKALARLERKVPLNVVKFLKEQISTISLNSESYGTTFAIHIDDIDQLKKLDSTKALLAITIGPPNQSEKSLIGLENLDLIKLVIFEKDCDKFEQIVNLVFPKILRLKDHIPIFMSLKLGGFLDDDNNIDSSKIYPKLGEYIQQVNVHLFEMKEKYKLKSLKINSFEDYKNHIFEDHNNASHIKQIFCLNKDEIPLNQYLMFLQECYEFFMIENLRYSSDYKKLVCYYDWLKYANGSIVNLI